MNLNFRNLTEIFNRIIPNRAKIALDLGSYNTKIAIAGKGIVLKEQSFVGYNNRTKQYIFYGTEAKDIYGKAPNFIDVIKPINHSIIADFDATIYLVTELLKKSVDPFYSKKIIKPIYFGYTSIPTNVTEVEQKALSEALIKIGFYSVKTVEKPIAVALGSNQPILTKKPIFIIDFGSGLIEMAVIIMGGIVNSKTIAVGGEYMDKILKNYIRLKYGLLIGDQTAENIKIKLFSLNDEKTQSSISGKSLENGLPKSIKIHSSDVREALSPVINQIVDAIKEYMETIPPETIDSIIHQGVIISGGLTNLPGIDNYLTKEIKIPVFISNKHSDTTINGLSILMDDEEKYQRLFI